MGSLHEAINSHLAQNDEVPNAAQLDIGNAGYGVIFQGDDSHEGYLI
jgi:hypothetical protein